MSSVSVNSRSMVTGFLAFWVWIILLPSKTIVHGTSSPSILFSVNSSSGLNFNSWVRNVEIVLKEYEPSSDFTNSTVLVVEPAILRIKKFTPMWIKILQTLQHNALVENYKKIKEEQSLNFYNFLQLIIFQGHTIVILTQFFQEIIEILRLLELVLLIAYYRHSVIRFFEFKSSEFIFGVLSLRREQQYYWEYYNFFFITTHTLKILNSYSLCSLLTWICVYILYWMQVLLSLIKMLSNRQITKEFNLFAVNRTLNSHGEGRQMESYHALEIRISLIEKS